MKWFIFHCHIWLPDDRFAFFLFPVVGPQVYSWQTQNNSTTTGNFGGLSRHKLVYTVEDFGAQSISLIHANVDHRNVLQTSNNDPKCLKQYERLSKGVHSLLLPFFPGAEWLMTDYNHPITNQIVYSDHILGLSFDHCSCECSWNSWQAFVGVHCVKGPVAFLKICAVLAALSTNEVI